MPQRTVSVLNHEHLLQTKKNCKNFSFLPGAESNIQAQVRFFCGHALALIISSPCRYLLLTFAWFGMLTPASSTQTPRLLWYYTVRWIWTSSSVIPVRAQIIPTTPHPHFLAEILRDLQGDIEDSHEFTVTSDRGRVHQGEGDWPWHISSC